ncbi:MAG: hypothetical protein WAO52_16330 [Prolixibacteraceae bacterium]
MLNVKKLYKENSYGIMGTLIFHILLVSGFYIAELKLDVKPVPEEAILLDFKSEPIDEKKMAEMEKKDDQGKDQSAKTNNSESNQAVNDASNNIQKRDKFFDENYQRDIEDAKKMVADVNKQLSKKIPPVKKFEMPEVTTEGQDPDSIKNTIYSGKSNIHYNLTDRFHLRLPIPVYLAKGGGEITIDIQVDRSGKVIKAEARPARNSSDPMLPIYATQAAERTLFNSSAKAPAVQKGTITYHFVSQ